MKTKSLFLILITTVALISCQRKHEYCVCKAPQGSNLNYKPTDWGTHTSFDNFNRDRQMCEAQQQKGYEWCSFSAE